MANRILAGLFGIAALGATVFGKQSPNPPAQKRTDLTPDELTEEARDYAWIRGTMSRDEFHAIRLKNKREREQFGDGTHAPHWPDGNDPNGHSTLYRGVWVSDFVPRPTNQQLDAFREEYWRTHEVVKFTLVEGEQDAPMGKDHAMIRVRATTGTPSEIRDSGGHLQSYIPMVSVAPVGTTEWLGMGFMGTLPMEMSFTTRRTVSALPETAPPSKP